MAKILPFLPQTAAIYLGRKNYNNIGLKEKRRFLRLKFQKIVIITLAPDPAT
jgi:hypothetical protein